MYVLDFGWGMSGLDAEKRKGGGMMFVKMVGTTEWMGVSGVCVVG